MDEKTKKLLLLYELPTISEFVSISWVQYLIAKYISNRINRKWKRYETRIERENFIFSLRTLSNNATDEITDREPEIEEWPNIHPLLWKHMDCHMFNDDQIGEINEMLKEVEERV